MSKEIKYNLIVKKEGQPNESAWSEEIIAIVGDVIKIEGHGKSLVSFFNQTLKKGEIKRDFVLATPISEYAEISAKLKHDWQKKSLVTEKGGYDIYKCSNCHATGKRYGVSAFVIIDYKFKKLENECPNTK